MFQAHFNQILNPEHPLVRLAGKIDWPRFDAAFTDSYCEELGAPTNRSNWIVAARLLKDNPYDGHTLTETLEATESITGVDVSDAYVDKGYRGSCRRRFVLRCAPGSPGRSFHTEYHAGRKSTPCECGFFRDD